MPTTSTIALFAVAAFALVVIPGPSVMYIMTRGISQGWQAALVSVLGIQSGSVVHITAVALGLSALLVSSATAFNVVKYAGAAYLIVMGVRTLVSGRGVEIDVDTPAMGMRRLFGQGILISILNPKVAIFFLAFFPQFVDPERGNVAVQTLVLGAVFLAIGVCSDTLWALLSGTLGVWLRQRTGFLRGQRYVAGGVYLALGVGAAAATPGGK